MISSFKVKRLKKVPKPPPNETVLQEPLRKPQTANDLGSFRQYCQEKYRQRPNTELQISNHSSEQIGDCIIQNEFQDWGESESKGISKPITPVRQGLFVTQKEDNKILPSRKHLTQQMTANMKRYKRLQFTNYLKDVIDDTAQVRLEAEQQANQIFGKGSIWRKFEKPQYFIHPNNAQIFSDLKHLDEQMNELKEIYATNSITPQSSVNLSFHNWTKRNLGSVHSRTRSVNQTYAIQDFRMDEIHRHIDRQTRLPHTSYQASRDPFKLDRSIDYFMMKAKRTTK